MVAIALHLFCFGYEHTCQSMVSSSVPQADKTESSTGNSFKGI
jgi:hypothetical protein